MTTQQLKEQAQVLAILLLFLISMILFRLGFLALEG